MRKWIGLWIGISLIGCSQPPAWELQEVASGVWVRIGLHQDADSQNHGAIANMGFIVGDTCIAVIDTGGSYQDGVHLRDAIRGTSSLPICYVINTHMHPDHIFGNAAFLPDAPSFVAHVKAPQAMQARQTVYHDNFSAILGSSFDGVTFIPATLLVSVGSPLELDLGNRPLSLTAFPTAHTDHDLTILDHHTSTLFTGDLLFVDRIPVIDGSINGWISVSQHLSQNTAQHLVPGHGPVQHDAFTAFSPQLKYLETVRTEIRAILEQLGTIEQAIAEVAQDSADNWQLFDAYHRRNVTAAFVELEWE